jgi:hypothetical protein
MTFTKHNECSSKGRKHFINKNIYKTHQLSKSNSTNPHSYNQLNKLSKKKILMYRNKQHIDRITDQQK